LKRIVAVLLALLLCLSLCASAFAEDSWTILVYICGSDLESESALATQNMQEMISAYTSPNIRFLVETGGASAWNNGASPLELDRFLITEGRSMIVDRQPLASMAESNTLRDFLRWGIAAYPSDHFALVLWDHGSGSINGVCFDELYDSDSLSLRDIGNALGGVSDLLPNGLAFIGFDACLMSTVETAAILAPYARYMVASQEIEPGSGWDYAAIGHFLSAKPGADPADVCAAICDGYYDNCIVNECEEGATLSVTDLGRIPALREAFDTYAKNLYESTDSAADYAPVARSIAASDNYGGNNHSEGYTNMIDLGGLIDAGASVSEHAKEARDALNAAIVYAVNGTDHRQASGLSTYYPLSVQGSEELKIFRDVCISTHYLALVDKVAFGYANGGSWNNYQSGTEWNADNVPQGQSSAISFYDPPALDANGVYGFILSEEGLNNTASVQAVVYLEEPQEDDSICLGYTSDVQVDWQTGLVEDNFDGYWFSLPDGQFLCVYLIDQCDGYDLFTSPVEINGARKNLRFSWDYATGRVEIMGVWDGVDENGVAGRPGESLKHGDRIVPLYDAFSNRTNEQYLYRGEAYDWGSGDVLSFQMLPDGEYYYGFCINDIYGGYYMTDFVNFTVDNGSIFYNAA